MYGNATDIVIVSANVKTLHSYVLFKNKLDFDILRSS